MSSLTKKPLKKKALKKKALKTTKKPLKTKALKKTTIKPLKKYLNKLKNIKKIGGDIEISRLGKLSDFINEAGSSIP